MKSRPVTVPKRGRKRWRQKGLLTALGFVFAFSAVLRLGAMDIALAEAPETARAHAPTSEPATMGGQDGLASPVAGVTGPLRAALAEVEALRDDLAAREAALADREQAVAVAQQLVEQRLSELEAAETRLEALIAVSDSAAETDIERLTRVYETMAPEQAAALFAQMDPSFASGFLSRMSPAASAALMAELDPATAYAVSVIIATRNAAAPRLGGAGTSPADTQN